MLKRTVFSLLTLLLLSGCTAVQTADQELLRFRSELLGAGGCAFDLDVTADFGDSISQFSLSCTFDPNHGARIRVTSPDSIAGICAGIDADASFVSFDGMQLALGSLAQGKLAPLAAPYVLASSWAGEYIAFTGRENGLLRATFRMGYDEKELTVDTWFTASPMAPVSAEISSGGQTVLRAEISNYTTFTSDEKGNS